MPSFTDDFNQSGVVMLTVHVDESGNVVSAEYRLGGSSISDRSSIDIAIRKVKQIKFAAGDESVGAVRVNLRVR